jgi:hypothetical protein
MTYLWFDIALVRETGSVVGEFRIPSKSVSLLTDTIAVDLAEDGVNELGIVLIRNDRGGVLGHVVVTRWVRNAQPSGVRKDQTVEQENGSEDAKKSHNGSQKGGARAI